MHLMIFRLDRQFVQCPWEHHQEESVILSIIYLFPSKMSVNSIVRLGHEILSHCTFQWKHGDPKVTISLWRHNHSFPEETMCAWYWPGRRSQIRLWLVAVKHQWIRLNRQHQNTKWGKVMAFVGIRRTLLVTSLIEAQHGHLISMVKKEQDVVAFGAFCRKTVDG